MALRDLLQTQVSAAFELLGDLKETVTFSMATLSDYDFETGSTSINTRTITTEAVVEFLDRGKGIGNTADPLEGIHAKLIIDKAVTSTDLNKYDSFTAQGKGFRVTEYINNGYTIEIEGVSQ